MQSTRHSSGATISALALVALLLLGGCGGSGDGDVDTLPTSLDLTAQADAFVCSDDWAANNYGNEQYSPRAVGRQNAVTGNQIGRQLYRFAAPSAWSGAAVASAILRLKLFDNYAGFPMDVAVLAIPDGWGEMTVTWNNQPTPETSVLDTLTATCCNGVYEFDVTAYVNTQLGGGDVTLSFILVSANEGTVGGLRWWQREGDGVTINTLTGEAPRLFFVR